MYCYWPYEPPHIEYYHMLWSLCKLFSPHNDTVGQFPRAAITKYHRLGSSSSRLVLSQFWGRMPRSRCWQWWLALPEGCEGGATPGPFPWLVDAVFPLCVRTSFLCPCLCPHFPRMRHQSHYLRPILMSLHKVNHLFRDPISKYGHILEILTLWIWGLGLQHGNFERGPWKSTNGRSVFPILHLRK